MPIYLIDPGDQIEAASWQEAAWMAARLGARLEGELVKEIKAEVVELLNRGGHQALAALLQVQPAAWPIVVEGKAPPLADRKTINLQSEYDQWNRKIFGGKLPKVPLKWSRSKSTGGKMKARRPDRMSPWVVTVVEISDFNENTYEEFAGILIHEMIHVKLTMDGVGEAHGKDFMDERRRASSMVRFDIPITEDTSHKKVSKGVPVKPLGVVYYRTEDLIQVFKGQRMPEVMQAYDALPLGWKEHHNPIEFYLVEHRDLNRYPVARKLPGKGRIALFKPEPELLKAILSGKKLGTLVVK